MVAVSDRAGPGVGYAIAMMVAVPAAGILHEIGHLVAALLGGFEQVSLRPMLVRAVFEGEPLAWQVAVKVAGPIMTLALVTLGAAACVRGKLAPWSIALACAAPMRHFASLLFVVSALLGRPLATPSDEAHIAQLTGTSIWWGALAGVTTLAFGWWAASVALRRLPKSDLGVAIGGLSTGAGLGWASYILLAQVFR